eukprot:scaffold286252_cov37-Prasinocladus_malaysianus.AAC.1
MRRSQSAVELRRTVSEDGTSTKSEDDGVFRIGKLTPEERREKILKYRQKRHERNFKKKIKYVCRKTLADSRPRVRGRFARNDDAGAVSAANAISCVIGDIVVEKTARSCSAYRGGQLSITTRCGVSTHEQQEVSVSNGCTWQE